MEEEHPSEAPATPAAPKPRRPREPPAPAVAEPSTLWGRIQEHKVLQWSLGYLGAALALAHGQELLAHTFHWPEVVGRLLMGGLIVGFPIVIVLAWFHGHKGLKHISAGEMTALAVLLLAGGSVLTLMVRSGHLGTEAATAEEKGAQGSATSGNAATETSGARTGAKNVRLAILPFDNLSPDPANAFFTDGLQEEIITTLAQRAPDLEVISRTTMMTYRQKAKSVSEVAKELGATHVIEGSVRREAQNVRLTLQLINARTDDHMWAQNYDRQLVSAMTLQTDVANEVAAQLAVRLASGPKAAQAPTQNPDAYDLYLKARLALQTLVVIDPPESFRAVEKMLAQAIERDPQFGPAYVTRFDVRLLMYSFNIDKIEVLLQEMQTDLEAVRRLMPNTPALLATEGVWALMDHQYARALALLSSAEAGGYAGAETIRAKADVMGRMGLFEDALPVVAHALELDPSNPTLLTYYGIILNFARRPAEAIKTFKQMQVRVPQARSVAELLEGYTRFLFGGNLDEFDSLVRRIGGAQPAGDLLAPITVLTMRHRYQEARELAAEIPSRQPTRDVVLMIPNGVGEAPMRDILVGQLDQLLGDPADAAKKGRAVLEFVAGERVTPRNEWYLKLLTSIGRLYGGDRAGAITASREALVLMPRSQDAMHWAIAAYLAAGVDAWAGSEDEAVGLLEQLSTSVPGIPPAEMTRAPYYSVPLAKNARYKALAQRLEKEMTAAKL